MTYKTFSDTPNAFTFNYTFKDFDTAQAASLAVMGYMIGTYEQPVIEASYHDDNQGVKSNQLTLEYAEDKALNNVFKRICDSFKEYYSMQE